MADKNDYKERIKLSNKFEKQRAHFDKLLEEFSEAAMTFGFHRSKTRPNQHHQEFEKAKKKLTKYIHSKLSL